MERITESEQLILRALWDGQPMTAAEVGAAMERERGWSLSTVKTLLARLVAKDAVVHEADGRRFIYRAALSREHFATHQSRQLIDTLFGGRAAPLVAHLARGGALTPDDIAEIEALLKAIKA
ncbi:BlaI/MecI/CopY family transcriptional regulator [Novosphingobium sp.]|uniref:BlaI/MecI/CopY family transcriptional regulator n=1 Tax=Novosphingobium sp. TaxID=1874826 RepID=UPI0031DF9BC9